jgi:hypothetical protein
MPSWDIAERARVVTVFDYQIEVGKSNSVLLPKNVRNYLRWTLPTGFMDFI